MLINTRHRGTWEIVGHRKLIGAGTRQANTLQLQHWTNTPVFRADAKVSQNTTVNHHAVAIHPPRKYGGHSHGLVLIFVGDPRPSPAERILQVQPAEAPIVSLAVEIGSSQTRKDLLVVHKICLTDANRHCANPADATAAIAHPARARTETANQPIE